MTDLSEAAPPSDESEGWKKDPTGANDWRWWDGSQWTERVGTSQSTPADPSATATMAAPTKVCPHCGVSAQTTSKKCPSCGKAYNKRTALKVVLGLSLVGLVVIIGCSALLVGGANEAVNELNREQERHAIIRAQFDALELGTTQAEVIRSLGKQPQDRQNFESEAFLDEEPANSSCIYYNQAGGEFLDTYQLCFDDGKLTSKNDW